MNQETKSESSPVLEVKEDGQIYIDGLLVSNQEVAREIMIANHFMDKQNGMYQSTPGIYPIPGLKWEVKESWGPFHENTSPEKVAVISLPESEKEKQKRLLIEIIKEDEKNGMYEDGTTENPILASLDADANLYDLNEKYIDFLLWFYKSQFGYRSNDHAMQSIIQDMREYQKSKP